MSRLFECNHRGYLTGYPGNGWYTCENCGHQLNDDDLEQMAVEAKRWANNEFEMMWYRITERQKAMEENSAPIFFSFDIDYRKLAEANCYARERIVIRELFRNDPKGFERYSTVVRNIERRMHAVVQAKVSKLWGQK